MRVHARARGCVQVPAYACTCLCVLPICVHEKQKTRRCEPNPSLKTDSRYPTQIPQLELLHYPDWGQFCSGVVDLGLVSRVCAGVGRRVGGGFG